VKINAIITEATGGISHPKPREIFHTDFFNLTPFDAEKAAQKVRLAEDAWNTRNPVRVSLAYTHDCVWRNRSAASRWLKPRPATRCADDATLKLLNMP
jgi:hypothetical protein